MRRHLHSIDEIKGMLADRVDDLCATYAPEAPDSYEHAGKYWTLNPGRADTKVGSFYVATSGPDAGRWYDFAVGQGGDALDLIGLATGRDQVSDQLREARQFLGLENMSPEDRRRNEERARQRNEARRQKRADDAEKARKRSKMAQAIWLAGQDIAGTPVQYYLEQRRGIDFARLGRWPGALRYHPDCYYKHTDETGKVIQGKYPAMVAIATNAKGHAVACHRTYLGLNPVDGRWDKADLPATKKVLGDIGGAWINVWKGIGPRGGKPGAMRDAPPGSMVYVTEGIEDALTAAMLQPQARHVAAYSLSNLGNVAFPPSIGEVVILADRDEDAQAQASLERAFVAHRAAGRHVRLWVPPEPYKDLNEALLAALSERQEAS